MTCIPRPPPKFLKPVERAKTPWDFFQSVFKDYKPDNEVLLAKCFEFDWEHTKLQKIVKSQEDCADLKKYLA